MAATVTFNDDFITFQGDDAQPVFTVLDATGTAVDISTAAAISWSARNESDAAVAALTLTKAGGAITLVAGGVTGQFQVAISAAQTALLNGWYQHIATITLGGKVTTVVVGRMQVGTQPSWTYDGAHIMTSQLFQVRRLIGDVIANDKQITDAEIRFALSERGSIYGAAADSARYIAAQYSRKVDTTTPPGLVTAYGTQAKKYLTLADALEQTARNRGAGVIVYAGGISVQDKGSVQDNSDRVQPAFNIGMTDSTLPVGQIGNETPTIPNINPGP